MGIVILQRAPDIERSLPWVFGCERDDTHITEDLGARERFFRISFRVDL